MTQQEELAVNNFIVTLQSTVITDADTVEQVLKHVLKEQNLLMQIVNVKRTTWPPEDPKVLLTSKKFIAIQDLMIGITAAEAIRKGEGELLEPYKRAVKEFESILGVSFYHE